MALLATNEAEGFPAVSPDGRWLAYETDIALFVRPYPDVGGGQWQITVVGNGLFRFAWSSDSTRLYFVRTPN